MVTYPSTSGVFDDSISEVCDMVHYYGGQVRKLHVISTSTCGTCTCNTVILTCEKLPSYVALILLIG